MFKQYWVTYELLVSYSPKISELKLDSALYKSTLEEDKKESCITR